ncbi:MAG: helix-turn-helix transcriptional regulator [Lachnospiraceae bacterium]|nr:helix-turn-helix transcriptional regulator [Lachnospiraceae bacterium]
MAISYQKLFRLLEEKGWTTYKIRKEKLIGQGTLTALKNGTGGLDSKTISRLCEVLDCQPGDIMEYIPAASNIIPMNNQHLTVYNNHERK